MRKIDFFRSAAPAMPGRLASTADVKTASQLDWVEVVRGLRNFLTRTYWSITALVAEASLH